MTQLILGTRSAKKKATIILFVITYILFMSITCFAQDTVKSDISDKIFKNTLVRMTWQEVRDAGKNKAIVLFPISVVEEHGPHMDLSPDILLASHMCSKMKDILEKDSIKTVVAPPYYWGINISTGSFPGSFNLKESTMKLVITEIIENMTKWGFETFYLVNFHGDPDQVSAVTRIASSINSSGIAKVYDISRLPSPPNPPSIPSETPGSYSPDYHAGASETKMVWSIEPSIVRTDIAGTLKPQNDFSPLGYVGNPAGFMNSKNDMIFGAYAEVYVKTIEHHLSSFTSLKKSEASIPNKFELFQNFPNPFNPETMISYQLPASLTPSERGTLIPVTLKVYDTLGREVAALVNKDQGVGKYEVKFNANHLSSGTYLVKLQAGDYTDTKKMMLIK